jgi:hypothetical protein
MGEWMYRSTFFLTLALAGGEWSASLLGRFPPRKGPPVSIGQEVGWPQSRSGQHGDEKILDPTGTRTRPLGRPARSQSLYQLCYPSSHDNWDYAIRGSSKYFMMINCIHTTCGVHICCHWLSFTDSILHMAMTSTHFYITICEQTKHVLHVRVCSTFTAVTFGQRIILMLSKNMGIKYASVSASEFGLEPSDIVMGSYLLPDRLPA